MGKRAVFYLALAALAIATAVGGKMAWSKSKRLGKKVRVSNLGRSINSQYVEYTPFVSPDGKTLYFESNRPGRGSFDLWASTNTATNRARPTYSKAKNLGVPINTGSFDGMPTLRKRKDGNSEIFFMSKRGGRANIYHSIQEGDSWSKPIAVKGVNTKFSDRMPSISRDGRYLYFSSNRPGGRGGDDIYVARRQGEGSTFSKPINMGKRINSRYVDATPAIAPDGRTLFFSSNRPGGVGEFDNYVVKLPRAGQRPRKGKPRNLGAPYNSIESDEYLVITSDWKHFYFASNRDGGYGGYDIYIARVPNLNKPRFYITLKGKVTDEEEDEPLQANLSGRRGFTKTKGKNAEYKLKVAGGAPSAVQVFAPDYYPTYYYISAKEASKPGVIEKDFQLKSMTSHDAAVEVSCQEDYCSRRKEPASTWATFAYLLPLLILLPFARRGRDRHLSVLFFSMVAISTASLLYHYLAERANSHADLAGTFIFMAAPMVLNQVRRRRLKIPKIWLGYAITIFVLTAVGAMVYLLQLPPQFTLAGLTALLIFDEVYLWVVHREPCKRLTWFVGALLLATASAGQILDAGRSCCASTEHVLQPHAGWHLAAALSMALFLVFYRQFVPSKWRKPQ